MSTNPIYTEATKVQKINDAFSELMKEYLREDRAAQAQKALDAFKQLEPESKARLFDILTKV